MSVQPKFLIPSYRFFFFFSPTTTSIYILGHCCSTHLPVAVHQMFFATSVLHVHLMQWDDENLVEQAVNRCDHVWESIDPNKVSAIFFIVVCYFF